MMMTMVTEQRAMQLTMTVTALTGDGATGYDDNDNNGSALLVTKLMIMAKAR